VSIEPPAAAAFGGESPTTARRGGHRRRRHPLTLALVAGAVLVTGSGSAWWASEASATGPADGSAPVQEQLTPDDGEPEGDSASGESATPERPVRGQEVNSYTADGRSLKVTFWGGVCGGYEASAQESAKKVTVAVRPKKTDRKQVCVKMARQQTVEVELDAPLGGRAVVDAADGEAMPEK
jgi:hypothetical protein